MSYSLLHVVHLLAAIAFIGTLFFEVIILAQVKPQLAPGAVAELQQALGRRTRTRRPTGSTSTCSRRRGSTPACAVLRNRSPSLRRTACSV